MTSTEVPTLGNSLSVNSVFQTAVNLRDDAASLEKVMEMKTPCTSSAYLASSQNQVLELLQKTP